MISSFGGGDLFGDAQAYLQGVLEEAESVKVVVHQQEQARRSELEELRRELEVQRLERRDSMAKIKKEFEEFVYSKLDKMFEDVERLKHGDVDDDGEYQADIEAIARDVHQFKAGLVGISQAWRHTIIKSLDKV
ncbi:unnamed protein product [Polarella glacialis]|nr:unnamed protein product [Polarella glacialis]|mmetsp:Transcript_67806/g.122173  ORF Transcript_67806/g.122173 Transcript_67806/m.122173 type:complete len:134 (-) Transcript_67806:42-443(-)